MDLFSMPAVMLPLLINAIALIITLIYGCREDIRERAVPVVMWYPAVAIGIPMLIWFWYSVITAGDLRLMMPLIPLILFFVVAFYLFTRFNLVGMADTKALILITVLIPCFPFVPLTGYPVFGFPPYVFLPFSVLFNAVVINLILPVTFFIMNVIRGNRAPLPYLFLGFPVKGSEIEDKFGIVMEEFTEVNGEVQRTFIGIGAAIKDLVSGGRRVYTKSLKEHPERYRKELALYRKAGTVWISYGVPFLIPITGGLLTALFLGDLFGLLIRLVFS
ncbi:MAG: peptidase A24 [Methanospirillum sp.]|uniref:A24 family peptidase C-terminal domain-containing protein n=1 Tax=Methanospirillum sp. TaxID=45200 RepID=UPI002370B079|nr:A24 family peptidase C-terminal domain-containing protein [Methanospirillum sp.]MDD1729947.1 peptidase A24 [Methanospirillum sp.]